MSQDIILLVYALVLLGFFSTRLVLKLAPLGSELVLKTLMATLLCLAIGLADAGLLQLPAGMDTLWLPLLVLAALYILAPFALPALARAGRYPLALGSSRLLYWLPESRSAVDRLLAQTALQQGDAETALRLSSDPLLEAQAYALQERWHEVLALEVPSEGDNAFLAQGARIWALTELNELEQAEAELAAMRALWQAQQGPIGYRSLALAQARLHAASGDFDATRRQLQEEPLPGVPPHVALMILAGAAARAQRSQQAVAIYNQAYLTAPSGQRPLIARRLEAFGQPEPQLSELSAKPSVATLSLALALVAAYGAQLYIDNIYGTLFRLNAAFAASAFLLNIPLPESDTIWRFMAYAFVHGGLIHIGFNVWVLYDIGRMYETRRNWGNLLTSFVIGSLVGAYLTSVVQAGDVLVLVGASGGVLGVAGALLADTLNSRHPHDRLLTGSLLRWIFILMLFSLAIPQVSLWGHAGGIVGGLLWGFLRQGLPKSLLIDHFAGGLSLLVMLYAALQVAQWLMQYA